MEEGSGLDKKHKNSAQELGEAALLEDYMADTSDDEGALAFINSEHCTARMANYADDDGWTPLILAARLGRVEVVDALLKKGADPNLVNWNYSYNALMFAIADISGYPEENKRMQLETVKLLISAGTDVNFSDRSSAFVLACELSRNEVLSELLKSENIDFWFRDEDGKTGLDWLNERNNADGLALANWALGKRRSLEEAGQLRSQTQEPEQEKRKPGI